MHFSLVELWAQMGVFAKSVVIALGAMSIASLVIAIERVLLFIKLQKESKRFAVEVGPTLAAGKVDEAAQLGPDKHGGYLGRVIGAGLNAYRTADACGSDVRLESAARALERQALREVQSMKRGISTLATVASTAPFVGLLGTVVGIVTAFEQMAASGSGGLATVSAGIAEALVATAFGLLVAIPAVMAFNYLQGWVDARAADLAESSNELLDVLARHLDRKAG